ncbi:O-phosphoseryl-tRNA(Sec) selenium transferase [Topomyia yanbarensis]|uniref:O-phosphoseryl-tRNA(Sec) selenium transferase n=1 Tax=Topomyia yanbarensis TaxID=2498891 RepID=UPI00273AA725|nr:O-phosphoseryl-tRNA(Sec) selenium transferase [Topomyia yanbarensis]
MNDFTLKSIAADLAPANYLSVASNARVHRDKLIKLLLEKKKIPEDGWENTTIEYFIGELSLMDSNNFPNRYGVGEREARIVCDMVRQRHYNFAHGIGRSGSLTEAQPKATGSTVMNNLTNSLVLDLIHEVGIRSCKKAILVPLATGMAVMMTLLSLKAKRPQAKYVLWSRIDQKSCFKSIQTAGLIPVVIDTIPVEEKGDAMFGTDLKEFRNKIEQLDASNICCALSTTSCFAPRTCDSIVELASLCRDNDIPHVVNNAYGLQSTYLTHQLEQAARVGRVDAFVQSTDKNLLVPVGGAIIAGFDENVINLVSESYPGRASSSQTLDVLITLLSLGKNGYRRLVAERKELHQYLLSQMTTLAKTYAELVVSGKNPISLALTLTNFATNPQMIGSMLHRRGVSGCRVVSGRESKTIGGHTFQAWGSHNGLAGVPYLTASAALGISREEVDGFISKLRQVLQERVENVVSVTKA